MTIDDLASPAGADIYYDQKFRVVLEDHMTFLRNHPTTSTISIKDHDAFKYEGDLSSLLLIYRVPAQLHWIVMRMNNFNSPAECPPDIKILSVPSTELIDRIRAVHLTQNKIKN